MDTSNPPALPLEDPARRVFIIDDHPLVREFLTNLIQNQSDLVVCGQAETSAEALSGVVASHPDVAIVDLSLNGELALELIKNLRAHAPETAVLVLTMHDEVFYAERALRAGARGYVMKRETTGKVVEAIRLVMRGKMYVSAQLSTQLAEKFVVGNDPTASSPIARLSDRELEVFELMGRGWETRRIAEERHLSMKTVQAYCARIKDKLGLENATELLREAVRWVEAQGKI
jgi:DNA-binding NarL/FixJ family response regulator